MDTLSRDSNGSGSILPLVGVIAGGLALVLSITALFKLSTLQKTVTAHEDAIANKIPALESEIRATAAKADGDVKGLRAGIQTTFDQVGSEIGTVKARLDKVEEAQKARAAAPAKGGAGPVTGTVDANGNYTVAKGDSLAGIARKFAVKLDSLEAENPGIDPRTIKIGQKIKIPRK